MDRRLAAILAADVAGFSAIVGRDEDGALRALKGHLAALEPMVGLSGGRIVKFTGDGFLAEFPSVVSAVSCAATMQRQLAERNAAQPEALRMAFRMGVHVGDVVIDGDDILGDGVNVAARLQEVAEPGGVAVSARVHEDPNAAWPRRIAQGATDIWVRCPAVRAPEDRRSQGRFDTTGGVGASTVKTRSHDAFLWRCSLDPAARPTGSGGAGRGCPTFTPCHPFFVRHRRPDADDRLSVVRSAGADRRRPGDRLDLHRREHCPLVPAAAAVRGRADAEGRAQVRRQ
jgi:hypothetical protein